MSPDLSIHSDELLVVLHHYHLEKLESKLRCSLQSPLSPQRSQSLILAQDLNRLLLIVKVHMMKMTMTTLIAMTTMMTNQEKSHTGDNRTFQVHIRSDWPMITLC